MFASLKNRIKEETGNDFQNIIPSRRRISSSASMEHDTEQKEFETTNMCNQCIELTKKLNESNQLCEILQAEKQQSEKNNATLNESLGFAKIQKNFITEEQEKIQNLQYAEIEKLKKLLSFREQEAVDRLTIMKQNQQQMENLTLELERLKVLEPMMEDKQDELEKLRHSSQLDKNNLTTTLAAIQEENNNLKIRLNIVEKSRMDSISSMSFDEKIKSLIQERKLLEQRLEETQLQLSDIKTSWSGQNLALETQVSRLSRQVAEETTEKRKALKLRDELTEKIKSFEFDLLNAREQIDHRDNKLKLLEEEIDELNLALRQYREDNENEILEIKNKLDSASKENSELKIRLNAANERLNEYAENSEQISHALRKQNLQLQEQIKEIVNNLEFERKEKMITILRNAEISQKEEILRKDLRIEQDECNDLSDKIKDLNKELKLKNNEINEIKLKYQKLNAVIENQKDNLAQFDKLNIELNEKNKSIKILNQRLTDMKKTLQNEIKNQPSENVEKFSEAGGGVKNISSISNGSITGPIVMDEVNFKYLKHVIVKFLTSREVEAIHLIRAVATLLYLNNDEEKLLYDTLNWKMSWFGTKPETKQLHLINSNKSNNGHRAFPFSPS